MNGRQREEEQTEEKSDGPVLTPASLPTTWVAAIESTVHFMNDIANSTLSTSTESSKTMATSVQGLVEA